MKTEMAGSRRLRGLLLSVLVAAGCGGVLDEGSTGGESHFLSYCDASCGQGLQCISGLCTRSCLVSESDCSDLHDGAGCTADSIEPGAVAVCDVACSTNSECHGLGEEFACEGGFCRAADVSVSSEGSGGTGGTGDTGGTGGTGGSASSGGASAAVTVTSSTTSGWPSDADAVVYECLPEVESDPIDVVGSFFHGEQVDLFVEHSGGCAAHHYSLCYEPGFLESYPVQGTLQLIHDDNGDTCEAWLSAELTFWLGPYTDYYESAYQTPDGIIRTNFGTFAWGDSCDDRVARASSQAEQAAELSLVSLNGNPVCITDDDCEWVSLDTRCAPSCGALVSGLNRASFDERLAKVDEEVCGDFEADGCQKVGQLPCPGPPMVRCVDNQCVLPE